MPIRTLDLLCALKRQQAHFETLEQLFHDTASVLLATCYLDKPVMSLNGLQASSGSRKCVEPCGKKMRTVIFDDMQGHLHVGAVPTHELLAHGFAEVAQEALFDVGPFVPDPDGTDTGSTGASGGELHDDRCPPQRQLVNGCKHTQSLGSFI